MDVKSLYSNKKGTKRGVDRKGDKKALDKQTNKAVVKKSSKLVGTYLSLHNIISIAEIHSNHRV